MEQRLTQRWYRDRARPSLLQPLAWLYRLVVSARRGLFRAGVFAVHRVGKPVIVVGNLTVGGTGKTPLVAWLAQQLAAAGFKVGIVSRGYGRTGHGVRLVSAGDSWRDVGDEPLLLRELSGSQIVVARDRVAGARELVALGADIIIADDGLQHLRLARDCEIVVIDGARGFGNGQLLPAGPLRENTDRLRTADLVVVNGACEHASLLGAGHELPAGALQMTLAGDTAWRLDAVEGPRALADFRGQRVHAVAGIGNPDRFFRDLRRHGLDVVEHAFPDHHPFTAADLTFGADVVLMTQKDAVKCREIARPHLWYVPVTASFGAEQARFLLDKVRTCAGAGGC